jgi:hypothetical protein
VELVARAGEGARVIGVDSRAVERTQSELLFEALRRAL